MIINSNSRKAALYPVVFVPSEPQPNDLGIYIGKSMLYKLPFFLQADKLVNPHISIIGMTGSGKTFLAKSIIARQNFSLEIDVLIIDWTSEYSDVVNFLGGEVIRPGANGALPGMDYLTNGVKSVDLSALESSASKLHIAEKLLEDIHSFMVSQPAAKKVRQMIVIDEAWKLLGFGQGVARLFREGRKFGFSILAATQLVADVNNEVLANAASAFIFRLQGSDNLLGLVSAGIISQKEVDTVPNLERGSCIVSLNWNGASSPSRFRIGLVSGLSFKVYTIRGEGLAAQIPEYQLRKIIEASQFGNSAKIKLLHLFEENEKGIGITVLVGFLMQLGLDRAEVIALMREFRIPDAATAMAIESQKVVLIE